MNKWEITSYKEGWSAGFSDNYKEKNNPYIPETLDYKMWVEGFCDGLRNWDMNMDDGG